MTAPNKFVIGIAAYDGVDLMDIAAPYELFNWMASLESEYNPGAPVREVRVYSLDGSRVITRDKLTIGADLPALTAPGPDSTDKIDLLWIPGGDPMRLEQLMLDEKAMDLLYEVGNAAQYTASVCEGAMLAAASGLLDGHCATTHWAFLPCLGLFPSITVAPGYPRYVIDGNRITGGGISSGIDEVLAIIALLSNDNVAGAVQLMVQYNPQPPFHQGDPSQATPPVYTPGENSTCSIPGMAATIDRVITARESRRA
ncbi:cyclohexyl-isocyanide hydratase [Andreprevotia lacus DSM 23236]|uniref:Cyclohexyl-isocyanide hydratase n=1 Tax=Andreprevotia lacus DSM 23236 TaxID=1121001 RepID=A0A1W1XV57_9NEIS|nr:DJ-1/PfpI family protein [Andreprevotia lacus]SMC27421.1 cyclohexyl-isocyanide hydratase [Andreprevotia lacus DSM 23236]